MAIRRSPSYAVAVLLLTAIALFTPARPALAQDNPSIRGRVVFDTTGEPVHGALILVVGAGRSTTTGDDGQFEIANVPPGRYDVIAQREHLSTVRQSIVLDAGQPSDLTFRLGLQPIHEELTVTASPTGESTTFEAFNAIQSLDSFDLARAAAPTLAAAVERAPGVEMRSFGPGSARPVIRGFDGDRVLILEDGVRSGDLSSQSGDHGTSIDPGSLDRVEIVRGPATLLYGSNAVGGLVHAVTPQETFRRTPFTGVRGQVLTEGGNNNGQAAGNANVQYSEGKWMVWAGGGSRRTGDYRTPEGTVENSAAQQSNGRVGFGYAGERGFVSAGYGAEAGRYGIPFAGAFHSHGDEEEHDHGHDHGDDHDADHEDDHGDEAEDLAVDLEPRRHNVRVDAGLRNLTSRLASSVRLIVNYIDWRHDEIEIEDGVESLGTRFDNTTTNVRAEIEQPRAGRLSGRYGASAEFRNYAASGEEALAPETSQRAAGVFAYEQLDFGPARLMFGGRFDHTAYDTEERVGPSIPPSGGHVHGDDGILPPATRDRTFTGASGAVGLHLDVAPGTALVTTLNRSYRAPALEELYNFGPHVGNLAFEIGNTNLDREATLGVDLSLRHRSARARGEINAFAYDIDNFVFASASRREAVDGLFVTQHLQGDSRFTGVDGQASVGLHRHLWVTLGVGYVRARLTGLDEYVPRIPPLRTRLSIEIPVGGLTVSPEIVWGARQGRVFRNETATAAYTVLNLNASYVLARSHHAHIFSLSGLNLTDELYRRHTSLIKDLAPEMGRSVRVSYGIRFF